MFSTLLIFLLFFILVSWLIILTFNLISMTEELERLRSAVKDKVKGRYGGGGNPF